MSSKCASQTSALYQDTVEDTGKLEAPAGSSLMVNLHCLPDWTQSHLKDRTSGRVARLSLDTVN